MSGKAKGSNYERAICKQLSLWVSGGEQADIFWRSAMSGGRATVARQKGQHVRQAGDIAAVAPEGHALCSTHFIELKHYKDLDIDAFFFTGKGRLAKFWQIAVREAQKYHSQPILIARQNRTPDVVLTLPGHWKRFLKSPPSGMTIVVRRKGFVCEVRLLEELLACPFNPR